MWKLNCEKKARDLNPSARASNGRTFHQETLPSPPGEAEAWSAVLFVVPALQLGRDPAMLGVEFRRRCEMEFHILGATPVLNCGKAR